MQAPTRRDPLAYRILRPILVRLARRHIASVHGGNHLPDGPCILAANHISWLDPVYLTAALTRITTRRMLFLAATGKHQWTGGVIPIDPAEPSRCLDAAAAALAQGSCIGIFIHGNRGPRASRRPKTGASRLARRSGCPIIPTALIGVKPGHVVPSIAAFLAGRQKISVSFGPPLRLPAEPAVTDTDMHRDMTTVDASINALLAEPATHGV